MSDFKIFKYDKITVFFKHTSYYGSVHACNYLEWMSYAREAYFQELVPNFMEICDRDIKMVTALTEFRQSGDAIFGDKICISIYSEKVRKLSFDVIFEFCNHANGDLLGVGRQRLTFLDITKGRPARIPEELKNVIVEYEKKIEATP